MQESLHFVVGQQSGLDDGVVSIFDRFGEVHHVHNMRTMVLAATHILRLEIIHPCATTFALTRVEVGIVHRQELALGVKDIIGRHIRVIYLDIGVGNESEAIEAIGQSKDALFNRLQFEIRTEYIIGDRIFGILEFLGIV